MSRRGCGFRLVAEEEPGVGGKPLRLKAPKQPAQCRKYLRQRLTEAFPKIVDDFVAGGRHGSTQRLKFVTELLGLSKGEGARRIGTRTLSRWVRETRERR